MDCYFQCSLESVNVELEGDYNRYKDHNLNEVALLHRPNIDLEHELVRTDKVNCSIFIKPVRAFIVIDVGEFGFCQDLEGSWTFHKVSAWVNIWILIVFHDSVHHFCVKQLKCI